MLQKDEIAGTDKSAQSGKAVSSPVSTAGGGTSFQAKVQALYLVNLLTGLPTVHGLGGSRVAAMRLEARYTGAHTEDGGGDRVDQTGSRSRCLVQCKRNIDVVESDDQFVEAFEAAWRDWHDATIFNRTKDTLVIASAQPV